MHVFTFPQKFNFVLRYYLCFPEIYCMSCTQVHVCLKVNYYYVFSN